MKLHRTIPACAHAYQAGEIGREQINELADSIDLLLDSASALTARESLRFAPNDGYPSLTLTVHDSATKQAIVSVTRTS